MPRAGRPDGGRILHTAADVGRMRQHNKARVGPEQALERAMLQKALAVAWNAVKFHAPELLQRPHDGVVLHPADDAVVAGAQKPLDDEIQAERRARCQDDPVAAWKAHNEDLARRCAYLNDLGITELEYHSSNGTNFKVGMIEDAEFKGGGENSLLGHFFNPNIPTEEVFISPMRGVAEGIVYSTKPLSYQGQLIENFSIRFEGGKAVEVHAEKNEALLQKLISMDEGASYLGECALVPYNSPIQNSGLLFYNTLFDENAACHLALGMGFADTIKNFENYTLDECRAKGINDSMVHEDFMIGSADLSIDAHTRDGRTVPIFRDGNWAF